jgi:stage II sporulation protein M
VKKHKLKRNIQKNILIYIIVFLIFASAVTLGALKASKLETEQYEILKKLTDNIFISDKITNYSHIVKTGIIDNLKIITFIFVCSLSYAASFLSLLPVAYKGFAIGFTSGFVLYAYGTKGILYLLSTVVIEGIIKLPVMMHMCSVCINYTLEKKNRKENTTVYFGYIVIVFLIMMCLSIINGIVSSFIIGRL